MTEVSGKVVFELDIEDIADDVCETSDFRNAVERVIDDYDFSYSLDGTIEDKISDGLADYVQSYQVESRILEALRDDQQVRVEIRRIYEDAPLSITAPSNEALEALVLIHKMLGHLSQQFAVVNNLMGVSAWPTNTGETLRELGSAIEAMGYSFSPTV
jgi:hypothetical protein